MLPASSWPESAAGLVTAIGFLGSGVIFARNKAVSGVTTSAGLWATVGIGMAMGSGMYLIGMTSTAMILAAETFCGRRRSNGGKMTISKSVDIETDETVDSLEDIRGQVEKMGFQITGISCRRKPESGASRGLQQRPHGKSPDCRPQHVPAWHFL